MEETEATRGFEDGYYRQPATPRPLMTRLYMEGYWLGCAQRRSEDEMLQALCRQDEARG